MKIQLKDGQVIEVEHDEGVLLIASGEGKRVVPEPKPEKEKKASKAKE